MSLTMVMILIHLPVMIVVHRIQQKSQSKLLNQVSTWVKLKKLTAFSCIVSYLMC